MSSNLPPLPVPYQPDPGGETLCRVRWFVDTVAGWVGAYDKEALRAYGAACAAAEREAWNDAISDALQSDMENGVKWLNEHAARDFEAKYPALAAVIRARGET